VPSLPEGYKLAALEIHGWEDEDTAFQGAQLEELVQTPEGFAVALRGLAPNALYRVRWAADGPQGRIYGPSSTLATEPESIPLRVPDAPQIESFTTQGGGVMARLLAPQLPPGARYLLLQVKASNDPVGDFADAQAATEDAPVELWGMERDRTYTIRWVAVGEPDSAPVAGPELVVKPGENLNQLPAPGVVAVGASEIWVQPQDVPPGAAQLTLEIRPRDAQNAVFVPAALLPTNEGQPLRIGYLWPNTAYVLRWTAQAAGAALNGKTIEITTRVAQ
jgi:hypothetical protein